MTKVWMVNASVIAACAATAVSGGVAWNGVAGETHGSIQPPEWFVTEIGHLTANGGRWITDNSEYIGTEEPWEEYGLEWHRAEEPWALEGRLFGLVAGEDRATFWEFRMWWDEDGQVARVWQRSGDGTVAEGTIAPTGNGIETEAVQTLTTPDGTTSEIRHLSTTTADRHVTASFDRVDGEWHPRRRYVWIKTPVSGT